MTRESLKPFDALTEADSRNLGWVRVDAITGRKRAVTLRDFYDALSRLELAAAVPEHIHDSFLTARHLAVYSWFVYRFTMVAQLQAYATLEYALRERLGHSDDERPPGLRALFNEAIAKELIDEERIRDWPGHQGNIGRDSAYQPGDWLRGLPEYIGYVRNDLAHGSFTLAPDGGAALRLVADIVNQLYKDPASIES